MQNDNIGNFLVEFDRTVTADWYEKSKGWNCKCGDCQNFLALAKQRQLPSAAMELLSLLGILPEKPTYVCELCPTEKGHLYQFDYRVAGQVLNDPHPLNSTQFDWGSVYCGHEDAPCDAPDFPEPYFDLMFVSDLPWVLNE